MKACVTTVRVRTGVGVQAVSGIVDRDGHPFVPEHLFFVNGSSVLDVLWSVPPGSLATAASANTNYYRVADGAAAYNGFANYNFTTIPRVVVSGGNGTGADAALDSLHAQAFLGGRIYRTAAITAVRDGGFDLTVTRDDDGQPTDVVVLALGSTAGDFQMEALLASLTTVVPTSFAASGLFVPKLEPPVATGLVAAQAGGVRGWGWGWDSPHGGPHALHLLLGNDVGSSPNLRLQRSTSFDASIDWNTATAVEGFHVTAWGPTSLTMGPGTTFTDNETYAVGGDGIVTASGTFLQPAGLGQQTISLGLDAVIVVLGSVGAPPTTGLQTGVEGCVAWTDGVRRASYWVGETTNTPPPLGAVFVSGTSLLRFAASGAQGAGTAFTAVADFVSLTPQGVLTIDWQQNDGIGRELLWFAIGHPPVPPIPPAPPGTIEPIRRLRQAPVLWDGAEGKRLKFPGFELLTEAGGPRDTDVAMPIVLQWSDDGGHSWGHEHRNEGARIGEHRYRYRWLRLGQARNRVFRVVCSADAKIVLIDALLTPDPVQGSS